MPPPRRQLPERAQAWLYTGPLGHFWSVFADLSGYGLRRGARRAARMFGDLGARGRS